MRYSRKLAALGRLFAGVAHEVKNPLNAMMIHLELLRQQVSVSPGRASGAPRARAARAEAFDAPLLLSLSKDEPLAQDRPGERRALAVAEPPPVDRAEAMQHVEVIANEIRRLDEVVQGFLKFSRPEDLKLQPVGLGPLLDEIVPIVKPEAERAGVELVIECDGAPDVNGDPAMLRQAFLNLALNACQAMPHGGTLRIYCEAMRGRRVSVSFSDTGVGIKPEHLHRIFDLVLHDERKGERHRPLDGVSHRADARRRDRSPFNTRRRNEVPSAAASIMKTLYLLALVSVVASGCVRTAAKTTPDAPPLDMPAPPPREMEPNDAETPAPVPLVSEPARSTPPAAASRAARTGAANRGAEARTAQAARTAGARADQARRGAAQAAVNAADDAGDRGR